MKNDHLHKLRSVVVWATVLLVLLTAAALIISCIQIYQSGDRPFTAEAISVHLRKICPIAFIGVIIMVIGFLLPSEPEKPKASLDEKALLSRYLDITPATHKEQKRRRNATIVLFAAIVVLSVYPILYFLTPGNFTIANLTGDIINAVLVAMIPGCLILILIYLHSIVIANSISREIAIHKEAGHRPCGRVERSNINRKYILISRGLLLTVAVVCIILGALNGGAVDVLGKAIRICTECIGLG